MSQIVEFDGIKQTPQTDKNLKDVALSIVLSRKLPKDAKKAAMAISAIRRRNLLTL